MDESIPSPNFFDEAAAVWDDKPLRVALATAIGETIVREVQPSQEMDALDYGCGTGLLSLFLLPHVRSVTGADSSAGMLDVLRRKIAQMALDKMEVMRLDLEHDSLPEKRFHMVATAMTMHHVRNTGKVLGAFRELLHPGGVLCVADLDAEPGTFHSGDVAETVHHHGFDRNEMKMHMSELGFADTRDVTAHTIRKEVEEGESQDFPVFLVVARRPE